MLYFFWHLAVGEYMRKTLSSNSIFRFLKVLMCTAEGAGITLIVLEEKFS
jgi:hypothetical protein